MKTGLVYIVLLSTVFASVSTRRLRKAIDSNVQANICIPKKFLEECQKLYNGTFINCVPGRDRMQCLEMIKMRAADFMVADPEDMYVAYHVENEDFDIIAEIRTEEEQHNPFRYDGIILVKKNSNIQKINDLKGKRSCHTGFGRNVGYKIPLTKLRKHNALKLSNDPELTSTEKELDALSRFFDKSCIVGNYSPDPLIGQILKKRYNNLCELCEDPVKCNYPDKYSGYDGAVRCVVEGNGDVAFTKTYFVKQFFGIPISPGSVAGNPRPDIGDYEYLCEDGTRQPITNDRPCSWAQRPWQGYMSNADLITKKDALQPILANAFNEGKTKLTSAEQKNVFIRPEWAVFGTSEAITPGQHLFKAQFKDVIERDGTEHEVVRLCVVSNVSSLKCKWLKRAAYSRDLRPQLDCVMKDSFGCIQAVKNGKADVVVLRPQDIKTAETNGLTQLMTEVYKDVYIGLVEGAISLENSTVRFDPSNLRSLSAALNFYKIINQRVCSPYSTQSNPTVTIISSNELEKHLNTGKRLLCSDLTQKNLDEFTNCHLDYSLPNGVMVKSSESRQVKDNIKHLFASIANTFGPDGKMSDVFDLYGEFEGQKDVIFSSDAVNIIPGEPERIDKKVFHELHCLN